MRAVDWLLREEIRVPGDWAVRRPKLEPGGWAFEFANDNYPDIDDTAEVVLALRGASAPGARADVEAAIRARCRWTVGMQSVERRLGRVRRRQHEPALRASSRSATSAR